MNTFYAFVTALAVSISLSAAPRAQDVQVPEGIFYNVQQPNQYLARDLILAAKVLGADGDIIGDIEDLIMNEDNQIVGVVMGVGGFLGVGEKRVGVRFRALTFQTEGDKVIVSLPEATPEVLKALPPYERSQPKKSLFDRAIEKAKELRDKTATTSQDVYEKAKEGAGPTFEKAREAAGEVYEKAKETTSKILNSSGDSAQPAEGSEQPGGTTQNQ